MATYLSWPSIRLLQAHVGLQLFEFGINACTRSIEKPAEQQIAYEKMPYGAVEQPVIVRVKWLCFWQITRCSVR
jgi:hypothetical protein